MKKLLSLLLLSVGLAAAVDLSIGVNIGPPPPIRVETRPIAPGADFLWVDGYWYIVGGRYVWHSGYWSRPPYAGAHWVGPHHNGRQYFQGYWEGEHGRVGHDHKWDRDKGRDYGRH